MTFAARFLVGLHAVSALLMVSAVLLGYGVAFGTPVWMHTWLGFPFALGIAFTHAMTMFYFAGIGVSMREYATDAPSCRSRLEEASRLRRRISWPLGLALVFLMATAILGGGTHTRRLPAWPHHAFAIAALTLNLYMNLLAVRAIGRYEAIIRALTRQLEAGDVSAAP